MNHKHTTQICPTGLARKAPKLLETSTLRVVIPTGSRRTKKDKPAKLVPKATVRSESKREPHHTRSRCGQAGPRPIRSTSHESEPSSTPAIADTDGAPQSDSVTLPRCLSGRSTPALGYDSVSIDPVSSLSTRRRTGSSPALAHVSASISSVSSILPRCPSAGSCPALGHDSASINNSVTHTQRSVPRVIIPHCNALKPNSSLRVHQTNRPLASRPHLSRVIKAPSSDSTLIPGSSPPPLPSDLSLSAFTPTGDGEPISDVGCAPSTSFGFMASFSDSDPTEISSAPTSDAIDPYSRPIKPIQRSKLTQAPADIRSFFSSTTAGKPSGNSSHRENLNLNRKRAIPPLTQLTLDISNRPTTQTCEACGMPYVIGVEEDQVIHAKHHRRVVGGIEWVSEETERVVWRDELKKERIVKVSLDSKRSSKMTKKVKQILEMVNVSLSARELSSEQLNDSALYLYLGENDQSLNLKKRRRGGESYEGKKAGMVVVKAVCVAARIDKAYKMVEEHADQNKEVIKFGEDGSAVFCSRVSQKALIGIHRIWTSPTSRGTGLAHQLMDAVTRTLIYNFPIVATQDRRALVAFSQPTESGMKFARKWCKSTCFNLF